MGIVAVVLLGVLSWLLVPRRKQRHLDVDIAAATTAAGAATTRQPFKGDNDVLDFALASTYDMVAQEGAPSAYSGSLLSHVSGGNVHAALGPGSGHRNTFGTVRRSGVLAGSSSCCCCSSSCCNKNRRLRST